VPPLLMIPNARDNAPNVNPVAEMPIDERPFRVRREGSHRAARIAPLTASLKDTLPPESRKGTRVAIRAFSGNIPGRPMSRTATPKAKKKKGAKSSRARKADATVNGGDGLAANGSARLSSVIVDSYNLERWPRERPRPPGWSTARSRILPRSSPMSPNASSPPRNGRERSASWWAAA
jgi:hypothetical protein